VSSFVKPGARMSVIADTVEDEIIKLKGDYVVVVWEDEMTLGRITPKRP
jgi:hypothetical protein